MEDQSVIEISTPSKDCISIDVVSNEDEDDDEIDITSIPRVYNTRTTCINEIREEDFEKESKKESTEVSEGEEILAEVEGKESKEEIYNSCITIEEGGHIIIEIPPPAPPTYASLIEWILEDAPPNYSEATGKIVDVNEVRTN